jgi:hypothetical protein
VDQANHIIDQVRPLLQQILSPFTEEQAALKAAQEAFVHEGGLEMTERQIPYLLTDSSRISQEILSSCLAP